LFKRDVILAQEYLAFTLLNLFDLFLTGYLFDYGGLEGNAVAALIWKNYHEVGFTLYKFLLVALVITVCEMISLGSVRKARFVVTFGCFVYVLVVLYECSLIYGHITGPPHPA
jgi:DMSO/TMAO reductase YedYZ heme-binding membrane subunit